MAKQWNTNFLDLQANDRLLALAFFAASIESMPSRDREAMISKTVIIKTMTDFRRMWHTT